MSKYQLIGFLPKKNVVIKFSVCFLPSSQHPYKKSEKQKILQNKKSRPITQNKNGNIY
jgi:hypothetical protein